MITIAPYNSNYQGQILPFILDIQQNEFNVPIKAEDQPDLNEIEKKYFETGGNFWIATDNKKLIGTIAMLNMGEGIAILRKMFVAKSYRGEPHRLGQKLLDVALAWVSRHGFKEVYIGTGAQLEAATRFYEKNGFQVFPEENLPAPVARVKMEVDNRYYFLAVQPMEKSA